MRLKLIMTSSPYTEADRPRYPDSIHFLEGCTVWVEKKTWEGCREHQAMTVYSIDSLGIERCDVLCKHRFLLADGIQKGFEEL